MLKESLIEFAKLVWDKERVKDEAINRVLTIEANKYHGKEVDPDTLPKPDEPKFPNTDILKGIGDIIEDIIDRKLGVDVEVTPVIEEQKAMEQELTRKYSDVSNKYNEILELVTASHQSIAQLMSEFNTFQSYMREHVEWGETTEADLREQLQLLTQQVHNDESASDESTSNKSDKTTSHSSVRVADLKKE